MQKARGISIDRYDWMKKAAGLLGTAQRALFPERPTCPCCREPMPEMVFSKLCGQCREEIGGSFIWEPGMCRIPSEGEAPKLSGRLLPLLKPCSALEASACSSDAGVRKECAEAVSTCMPLSAYFSIDSVLIGSSCLHGHDSDNATRFAEAIAQALEARYLGFVRHSATPAVGLISPFATIGAQKPGKAPYYPLVVLSGAAISDEHESAAIRTLSESARVAFMYLGSLTSKADARVV